MKNYLHNEVIHFNNVNVNTKVTVVYTHLVRVDSVRSISIQITSKVFKMISQPS